VRACVRTCVRSVTECDGVPSAGGGEVEGPVREPARIEERERRISNEDDDEGELAGPRGRAGA
jgi:hypothetical protein